MSPTPGGPPRLCLVAALAENDIIGAGQSLPWHLPADLAHFRRLTLDKTILMGRRTWESLPGLLPRRRHLVLTRNLAFRAPGAVPVATLAEALTAADGESELMVVGGAALYALTLPLAECFHLTRIHAAVAGDTRFPPWDPAEWRETARGQHPADGRNAHAMTFIELHRVGVPGSRPHERG